MAYITVGLDENKVYKKAQPPGGRCSDWVPTSPAPSPHHVARSQKPSSRDQLTNQMTSQLTNQINQMSLVPNQTTVGQINPANPNPRQVGGAGGQGYEGDAHLSHAHVNPPTKRVQRQSTTTGDYGLSVDEMLEHNSAVAKGGVSRFQPHFEASDRRRTPGGLLRHAPVNNGSSQLDGKKMAKMPPGGHSSALW